MTGLFLDALNRELSAEEGSLKDFLPFEFYSDSSLGFEPER